MIVVLMYIILYVPIDVCFNLIHNHGGNGSIINSVVDVLFTLDIFITFISAYEDPITSKLITNLKKIGKKYIYSWFFIDLIAIFPFEFFEIMMQKDNKHNRLIKLARLPRFFRLLRMVRIFKILKVVKVKD